MPSDKNGNYHTTKSGYLRYHSGAFRNQFVHRVIYSQHIGRPLSKDEDIHHKDGNRGNPDLGNLRLVGHREHGWYSAKQHWYMKQKEKKDQQEWENYHGN